MIAWLQRLQQFLLYQTFGWLPGLVIKIHGLGLGCQMISACGVLHKLNHGDARQASVLNLFKRSNVLDYLVLRRVEMIICREFLE